jgi:hypothetical protein
LLKSYNKEKKMGPCAWKIFKGYDGTKEIWTLCQKTAVGFAPVTSLCMCEHHMKKSKNG